MSLEKWRRICEKYGNCGSYRDSSVVEFRIPAGAITGSPAQQFRESRRRYFVRGVGYREEACLGDHFDASDADVTIWDGQRAHSIVGGNVATFHDLPPDRRVVPVVGLLNRELGTPVQYFGRRVVNRVDGAIAVDEYRMLSPMTDDVWGIVGADEAAVWYYEERVPVIDSGATPENWYEFDVVEQWREMEFDVPIETGLFRVDS